MLAYGKLNLNLINSIYSVSSLPEIQRRLIHNNFYYNLFYSATKETCHKPSKIAGTKNFFPSVYVLVQLTSINVLYFM